MWAITRAGRDGSLFRLPLAVSYYNNTLHTNKQTNNTYSIMDGSKIINIILGMFKYTSVRCL